MNVNMIVDFTNPDYGHRYELRRGTLTIHVKTDIMRLHMRYSKELSLILFLLKLK